MRSICKNLMRSPVFALMVALATSLLSGYAFAIDIPPLGQISTAVADANPSLVTQRSELQSERNELRTRTQAHNRVCQRDLSESDPAFAGCRKELQSLTTDVERHVEASKQFNATLALALKAAATVRAQTASFDTNVVDARNVPSGLPKSVDDAITAGYSGAPPGVSDRVRKGFQAVATHDWILAKAWFGDALNYDPTNAGLKRLVELADYTGKRIQQEHADKQPGSTSTRTSVQLPEDSDIQYLFPGWEPAKTKPLSNALGKPMELPKDSDIEFLFPGLQAIEAKEMNDYMFKQALKDAENDPVLVKSGNRPDIKQPQIPAK